MRSYITVAAIRHTDGSIFVGRRHSDCIMQIYQLYKKQVTYESEQGFLDNKGNFWDRISARKVAEAAGQLPTTNIAIPLYSEDLW